MIKGSISVKWKEEDYKNLTWRQNSDPLKKLNTYDSYSGFLDVNNYMCSENLPKVFYEVADSFNLKSPVISVNKMIPGQILPYHSDYYQTYSEKNNVTKNEDILRIIVFLHDQKVGHQLWIENEICVGHAGSYFGWYNDTKHMAANIGIEDRFILQITSKGFYV